LFVELVSQAPVQGAAPYQVADAIFSADSGGSESFVAHHDSSIVHSHHVVQDSVDETRMKGRMYTSRNAKFLDENLSGDLTLEQENSHSDSGKS
jgi:hypothetical protein